MKLHQQSIISVFFTIIIAIVFMVLGGCQSQFAAAPVSNLWYQQTNSHNYYRVRAGDTLYSIAWMFGLDYRSIAAANHLSAPYSLTVGQKLKMTTVPKGEYNRAHAASRASHPSKVTSAKMKLVKRTKPALTHHYSSANPKHWRWPARGQIIRTYKKGFASNSGIDISGHFKEPIYAAAAGIVVYSGSGVRGYGNLVIIKHGAHYLSAYAYNDINLVKLGQIVKSGTKIALMGKNNAGNIMLHFEIRKNGVPVDPFKYLHK